MNLRQELKNAPELVIRGRHLLPIVQGGMGVGVSAHRLAGAVAKEGAFGTIASIDLRHHHPDLLEEGGHRPDDTVMNRLNLVALDREIKMALDTANGEGMIAVNVMKAVDQHRMYIEQACKSGVQAIVMGAGLPLDLPDLTAAYPDVALIPILSDARGIALIVKKWMRKNRLPDAIVIEHPRYAGGHLGAAKIEDLAHPRFDFEVVIPETLKFFEEMGIAKDAIPLIPAGGINTHQRVMELFQLGAKGVQLGTAFAVSQEGDAHPNFKEILANAQPEDIVEFMSVAGLPARGVSTQWLSTYLRRETHLQSKAKCDPKRCTARLNCLTVCGLRDGIAKQGQFCIDNQLAAAVRGEVTKGLFFRGACALPFGNQHRPVRELLNYLVTGTVPEGLTGGTAYQA